MEYQIEGHVEKKLFEAMVGSGQSTIFCNFIWKNKRQTLTSAHNLIMLQEREQLFLKWGHWTFCTFELEKRNSKGSDHTIAFPPVLWSSHLGPFFVNSTALSFWAGCRVPWDKFNDVGSYCLHFQVRKVRKDSNQHETSCSVPILPSRHVKEWKYSPKRS